MINILLYITEHQIVRNIPVYNFYRPTYEIEIKKNLHLNIFPLYKIVDITIEFFSYMTCF